MVATNVVSLLPRLLHDRLERALADGFTGSIEIHIEKGSIRAFKAVETTKIC